MNQACRFHERSKRRRRRLRRRHDDTHILTHALHTRGREQHDLQRVTRTLETLRVESGVLRGAHQSG